MEKVYAMDEGRDGKSMEEMPSLSSSSSSSNNSSYSSNNNTTTPLLSAVNCTEDKLLIIDVLNAIRMCRQPHGQLCTSWSVHPCGNGYILTAYLPTPNSNNNSKVDVNNNNIIEVTHDDLSMIESVNLLRVRAGVAHLNADTWALRIHITSHKSPVSFTVHDTLRFTQRRSLIWNSSPSVGAATATVANVVDQGKTLLKNMFSRSDSQSQNRFSMSADNTNPNPHMLNATTIPDDGDHHVGTDHRNNNSNNRKRREREDY